MPIRLPSHLHKNRCGVFGFRIVIPRDLRVSFARQEFRLSLRTTNKRAAKRRALRLAFITHDYFDRMRQALTLDEAIALGKELVQALGSASFDDLTDKFRSLLPATEGDAQQFLPRLIELRDRASAIQATKLALTKELIDQFPGKTDAEIDSLTCDFYDRVTPLVSEDQAISNDLRALSLLVQQFIQDRLHASEIEAQATTHLADKERLADFAAEITARATIQAAQSGPRVEAPAPPGPTSESLSTVLEAYCTNQISEGNWTAKTEQENRAILNLWLRIVGDQPIRNYGFEQHRGYRATLNQLPANINKTPQYRDKSIEQIVALKPTPSAPNTRNKSLTRVAALFKWAVTSGYTSLDPASGMTIKNPRKTSEERKAFTPDDLCKLFHTAEYIELGHTQPHRHWTPLIALYSGARLNEIAQLHVDDFREVGDIPIISINDEGTGKRVKTDAGKRQIPVHPELIRLGLLRYVEDLRSKKNLRLFPELKESRDGYGQTVSKWFARYRKRCGITEERKVFHSFRHTVIDQLKQASIPKEKIASLVGHEDESVTFGRYGKDFQPAVMSQVVSTLQFDATSRVKPYESKLK